MPDPIPIACTLSQAELPDRAEQIAELGRAMTAIRVEGREARLRFPLDRRHGVEAFVAAESSCCPFFTFEQRALDDQLELRISAPDDGEWAVRGLVAGFAAGWGGLPWADDGSGRRAEAGTDDR